MTKDDLVSKDTALKMAIEAMDDSMIVCENLHHAKKDQHKYDENCPVEKRWNEAINACKEALEQPGAWLDEMQGITQQEYYQEPVAWTDEYKMFLEWDKEILCDKAVCKEHEAIPLYTHPYQWRVITKQEIIQADNASNDLHAFARAIEQKLKEKNHA